MHQYRWDETHQIIEHNNDTSCELGNRTTNLFVQTVALLNYDALTVLLPALRGLFPLSHRFCLIEYTGTTSNTHL